MRTMVRMMAIAACWTSVALLQAQPTSPTQTDQPDHQPSWIQQLDIDQVDPTKRDSTGAYNNLGKIFLMLHSEDVPRARRLEYARRYLRGEYKYAPKVAKEPEVYECIMDYAIWALGRLNDTESIPLLEELLHKYEMEEQNPSGKRTMDAFPPETAKAVLARLKAVRDVPRVQTATDLIRRLERMLHHIGFAGSIESWQRELETKLAEGHTTMFPYRGVHYWVLKQYGQLILEAGWSGVEVDPACKVIQLRRTEEVFDIKDAAEIFEVYVQLAKAGRDKAAQWIVDDAMNWKVLGNRGRACMTALMYMGTSVVPLVWSKMEWAARHRDRVKEPGMGLVGLLEVLVNLGGKQALPLIEPFLNDEDKWVRYYACWAKEYIEQGKMFLTSLF